MLAHLLEDEPTEMQGVDKDHQYKANSHSFPCIDIDSVLANHVMIHVKDVNAFGQEAELYAAVEDTLGGMPLRIFHPE